MANEQNLKKISSTEQAREMQKKSAKNRKEQKLIKDRILEMMKEDDWDEMILGVISRAKDSDKAFEILRDTIGQKPSDKVEVSGIAEEQSKLDEILKQRRSRHAGK